MAYMAAYLLWLAFLGMLYRMFWRVLPVVTLWAFVWLAVILAFAD